MRARLEQYVEGETDALALVSEGECFTTPVLGEPFVFHTESETIELPSVVFVKPPEFVTDDGERYRLLLIAPPELIQRLTDAEPDS